MTPIVAVTGGTLTWYLSRATGVVSLAFLTASVLLGILTSFRWSSPRWPRFVVEFVHRNVSLLVVVFVAAHVVIVISDSFAPIGWVDAVIPFVSAYRPLWLGFGAIAFDLVVALVVTSLLRHRLGYRSWRIVHWLAYLCWPVAVLHGLGTGSDTKSGVILVLTALCVVAVLVAGALRVGAGLAGRPGFRAAGFGLLAALPVLLVLWLVSGPLADGWARRAGTPDSVLAAAGAAVAVAADGSGSGSGTGSGSAVPTAPTTTTAATPVFGSGGFSAETSGTFHQSAPDSSGHVTVSLVGPLRHGAGGSVDVELSGSPLVNGGVSMSSGTVTVSDGHSSYQGAVVGLRGGEVVARMPGPGGVDWQVGIVLTKLDQASGVMSATVQAAPASAGLGGAGDRGAGRGGDDG
jgi:DMSO/TMAO reductase YedYZ heme-binding membrane subunit